jgi:hypothetical protein
MKWQPGGTKPGAILSIEDGFARVLQAYYPLISADKLN